MIGVIVVILIFISFTVHGLVRNFAEWDGYYQRDYYRYSVNISGLEGKIVNGTTKILVPIPANSNGKLVSTPAQKEPGLSQKFVHEYISHTPPEYRKGPYFENTSESFDNRKIDGNWISCVVDTEDGCMLCFQTNASVLENIYLKDNIVVNYVNGLDPLDQRNPILYPANNFSHAENFSDAKKTSFEIMGVYNYDPAYKYDSFVHTSNNLDETELTFSFSMYVSEKVQNGHNSYSIISLASANSSGKTKVEMIVSEPDEYRGPYN